MTFVLCPSCEAEWLPDAAVVVHEDNCPRLAVMRRDDSDIPCQAVTGFCGCRRHTTGEPRA